MSQQPSAKTSGVGLAWWRMVFALACSVVCMSLLPVVPEWAVSESRSILPQPVKAGEGKSAVIVDQFGLAVAGGSVFPSSRILDGGNRNAQFLSDLLGHVPRILAVVERLDEYTG